MEGNDPKRHFSFTGLRTLHAETCWDMFTWHEPPPPPPPPSFFYFYYYIFFLISPFYLKCWYRLEIKCMHLFGCLVFIHSRSRQSDIRGYFIMGSGQVVRRDNPTAMQKANPRDSRCTLAWRDLTFPTRFSSDSLKKWFDFFFFFFSAFAKFFRLLAWSKHASCRASPPRCDRWFGRE